MRAQIRALTAKDGPAGILRLEEWESILALISGKVVIGQSVSAGAWETLAKSRRTGGSLREITLMTVVAASGQKRCVKMYRVFRLQGRRPDAALQVRTK